MGFPYPSSSSLGFSIISVTIKGESQIWREWRNWRHCSDVVWSFLVFSCLGCLFSSSKCGPKFHTSLRFPPCLLYSTKLYRYKWAFHHLPGLHFYLPMMNNYSLGDLYAALDDVHFPKMESRRSEIYDLGERMLWKKKSKIFSHIYSTLGFAWINQWVLISLLQFEFCRWIMCCAVQRLTVH